MAAAGGGAVFSVSSDNLPLNSQGAVRQSLVC